MDLWLIPIGAIIGYSTNYLAVRMVIRWLIPRKEKEIRMATSKEIFVILPWYLNLPIVRDVLQKDIEETVSKKGIEVLCNQIYRIGRLELRGIEFLGALIGALVGVIGLFI